MSFGGLQQVADLYHDSCAKYGNPPQRLMCSYFTHFADTKAQEDAQRARQIRYYRECVIPALPGDPKTAPPSYRYFVDMVDRLGKVKPEELSRSVENQLDNFFAVHSQPTAVLTKASDALPAIGIVAAVLGIVITMASIAGDKERPPAGMRR